MWNIVIRGTTHPPFLVLGGTTVLFQYDNAPPVIGEGLLSGTWGTTVRDFPDNGPPLYLNEILRGDFCRENHGQ
jgi:hypothetical protein